MLQNIIDTIAMLTWNLKEGNGFNMTSVNGVGIGQFFEWVSWQNRIEGAVFMMFGLISLTIIIVLIINVVCED